MTSSSFDLAIAGGGAIGMACAWRAAGRGLRTVVIDAGDPGAWQVAAGMLAPVAEAEPGDAPAVELGLRAARGFAGFCAELAEASGEDPGHRPTGTLLVARDRDEAEALERALAFRRELGLEVERLRPSQARRAEPALAPTVRLALDVPGDHSVDPRRLVAALTTAFERAGGTIRRARVAAVETDEAAAASPASASTPARSCRRARSSSRPAPGRSTRRTASPFAPSRARSCDCATRAAPG